MIEVSPAAGAALPAEVEFAVGVAPPTPLYPNPAQVIRNHRALLEMSAEVFPGAEIDVTEEVDPEIPGDPYLVICVTTSGEVPELVAKHREWHFLIWERAPETAQSYRLRMDVR